MTTTQEATAQKVFKEELALIKDQEIKGFVVDCLNDNNVTPNYFWVAAASSSGKYHPRWDLGEGGTVRHTKMVAFYGQEFTRALALTKEEVMNSGLGRQLYEDVVIAACMLHDIQKFGMNYDGTTKSLPENNTKMHGILAATFIFNYKLKEKYGANLPMKFKCILRGIAGHMGIWTDDINRKAYWPDHQKNSVIRKVCQCVHYADYAGSRRPPEHIEKIMEFGKE